MVNKIWYPGSAYADLNWIEYLQNKFTGNWYFSDINKFENWDSIIGNKFSLDTINDSLNDFINFDILIISRHPNYRDVEGLLNSNILTLIRPKKFIYDPGTNKGTIDIQLEASEKLFNHGYKLNNITILPSLFHQYCEFDLMN